MKKLAIFILGIGLSIQGFSDIYGGDSFDFSRDSLTVLEVSSYALFSSALSEASSNDEYAGVKDRYEYFDNLVAKGESIKAQDIFSEQGLKEYALNKEDIIDLNKINVGILVSNLDRPIILVPSDVNYSGLTERKER